MARLPFFESTWRRKARLTGVVLGVYAATRLLATLSNHLIGLGWSDLPVSLLAIIYLAFLYVEVWIILERHTRPALSLLAALLLAGLCVASPFIAFDPVASGSVPDRMRFWEPSPGLERSHGQKVAILPAARLREPLDVARNTLERVGAGLLAGVGLRAGSDQLTEQEAAALSTSLGSAGEQAGLTPTRARLLATALVLQLSRQRAERTAELIASRAECVGRAQQAAAPLAGDELACGALVPLQLTVPAGALAPFVAQQEAPTATFLEPVAATVGSWIEAAAGSAAGAPALATVRLTPEEDPARPFAAILSALAPAAAPAAAVEPAAPTPPTDGVAPPVAATLDDLPARVERHRSALMRYLAELEQVTLLEIQLAGIGPQLAAGLAGRKLADGRPEWSVVERPALVQLLASKEGPALQSWLDVRPREVLAHVETVTDPERQAAYLGFLSQTQHWHLRDPAKIKARLEQAEDEYRSSETLGTAEYPPVGLCQAMSAQQTDAAVVQLAGVDRGGDRHLRLLLVQASPCLTVWDHDVPIYDQADVLGSTADDSQALSETAAAFFAPSLLGTDYLGKDVLMQLVKGTEGFFLPGLLAVAIGLGLGVLLGAFAGYMGGAVDQAITFFTTLIGAFPRLVFILLICTIPESPSMLLIGGITGALFIPQVAEAVRRRVLALKAEDFIVASRAHGLSLPRILFYHMVWLQCFPEIVRQALYLFVYVIFLETALSYLEGPGAPPEIPSWGRMLANATAAMFRGQYWHALVPTAAIVFTTLGVAALGDVIVGQAKEERL